MPTSTRLPEGWLSGETVTIEGETISGAAGCNQYPVLVDWSAEAGAGHFVVSELSWTEMSCDA
jgi:heat shock protein HslJ